MTEEDTTTDTTVEAPNFGIQDLVFTLQIIEACSTRGAFRADELTNVTCPAVVGKVKAVVPVNSQRVTGVPVETLELNPNKFTELTPETLPSATAK